MVDGGEVAREAMPDALTEALALYLRLASLEAIRQTLDLFHRELAQRGIAFHFTLGEPPAGLGARCALPGAGDPGRPTSGPRTEPPEAP